MYRKNVVLLPQGRLGLVMLGYIKIVGNMGYEKVGNMSNVTLQKLEKRAAACFYLFPTIFCGTCERNCRMSYQGMLKNGPKESQFLVLFLFSWLFGSFSTRMNDESYLQNPGIVSLKFSKKKLLKAFWKSPHYKLNENDENFLHTLFQKSIICPTTTKKNRVTYFL